MSYEQVVFDFGDSSNLASVLSSKTPSNLIPPTIAAVIGRCSLLAEISFCDENFPRQSLARWGKTEVGKRRSSTNNNDPAPPLHCYNS